MSIKPVPRKRRREKELQQAKTISFITGALLLLTKLSLIFPAVLVLSVIVCLIDGSFSGLGRTAGSTALYILIMWAVCCVISAVRIAIGKKASGKSGKTKNRPDEAAERIDKANRNTSRKRIAKQKTLARKASNKNRKK